MNNDVVILNLDRPRLLKYGHTPMKVLEEITGMTITELDEKMNLMDHELREKMVYAGLLLDAEDHQETLTLDQVAKLLDKAPSFVHILKGITRAWRIAFGADAGDQEGNQQGASEKNKSPKSSTGTKAKE